MRWTLSLDSPLQRRDRAGALFTVTALALVCLSALQMFGQNNAKKKEYTLDGKLEAVNRKAGTLTVNHGKVEGWMDAMTMAYPVDKPEPLKSVKAGDRIKETVFRRDLKLHNLKIVQPQKASSLFGVGKDGNTQ